MNKTLNIVNNKLIRMAINPYKIILYNNKYQDYENPSFNTSIFS